MASQQQVLFAETIAGMKKALKRRAYDSDSDSEIDNTGNRGQKLKKRARFARRGQLVPTVDPASYKEIIDYAGVRRSILHRNPPLVDEEGYEVDSDDDPDRVEDAVAAAAELDPYANIRLEHILAPLIATTELPSHQTLSKPFTSKTLSDLVQRSCSMMRTENHSLWQVRHLWTTLCGDYTWAPCETMIGPNDVDLFTEDHVAQHLLSLARGQSSLVSSVAPPTVQVNGEAAKEDGETAAAQDRDVTMAETGSPKATDGNVAAEAEEKNETTATKVEPSDTPMQNGDGPSLSQKETNPQTSGSTLGLSNHPGGEELRQQIAKLTEGAGSVLSDGPESDYIHPMFQAPANAKPDATTGLAEPDAEHLRKLLALYVQKQEEVCRGAAKLHEGLLKAERLRNTVLHWSKAEAHCGPNRDMSDGEDWYDREEWGLDEDLKKGQDEEEEDTTTTGKKTTRARR